MLFDKENLEKILEELKPHGAALVAVSKMKPVEAIKEVYDTGHKIFGENYVQELVDKAEALPKDIEWHFIGHLQSNKVKMIAPFVRLIHGVDSLKLLQAIDEQAKKNNRVIDCLLQIHIAQEETKFGLSFEEADGLLSQPEFVQLKNICVKGFMGMASLTEDMGQVRKEFRSLSEFFHRLQSAVYKSKLMNGKHIHLPAVSAGTAKQIIKSGTQTSNLTPQILSMGMTSDYKIALEEGSNMVRIGSAIFGER